MMGQNIYTSVKYGRADRLLGRGTYGEVYATTHGYAVKIINRSERYLTTEMLNEMLYPSMLEHPNVITYHKIELLPNRIVMVMDQAVCDISKLTFTNTKRERFVDLAFQLIVGVAHLTSHDLIHRDIKPQNILYLPLQGSYRYIITDFGLSIGRESKRTISDYNIYTPPYRPPEIILSLPYTSKADVWALGCTLYEMYTDTVLFMSCSPQKLLTKIYTRLGFVPPTSPLYAPSIAFTNKSKTFPNTNDKTLPNTNDKTFPNTNDKTLPNTNGNCVTGVSAKTKGRNYTRQRLVTDPEIEDLLSRMLQPDPDQRESIFSLQHHPLFSQCEEPERIVEVINPPFAILDYPTWSSTITTPVKYLQRCIDWLRTIGEDVCQSNISFIVGVEILYRYYPTRFHPSTSSSTPDIGTASSSVPSLVVYKKPSLEEIKVMGMACLYIGVIWTEDAYPLIEKFVKLGRGAFTMNQLISEVDRVLVNIKFDFRFLTQDDRIREHAAIYSSETIDSASTIATYALSIPDVYYQADTPIHCINLALQYDDKESDRITTVAPTDTQQFLNRLREYYQEYDLDPDIRDLFDTYS